MPDGIKTPGAVNVELTAELMCSKSFRTGPYRNVSIATKKKVFALYGIEWNERSKYEVDHLISLELGGSNEVENLWPEPYEPRPGAHEKDLVENYLHRQVCAGKMTLDQAQHEIATDWYSVYKQIRP